MPTTMNLFGQGNPASRGVDNRIEISAQQAARVEYSLRKLTGDFEKKQLSAKEELWQKELREEEAMSKKKLREEARLHQQQLRDQLTAAREKKRETERFWRDLSIGGIVGMVGGRGGVAGLAGAAGSLGGGAIAGAMGLSGIKAGLIAEIAKVTLEFMVNPMKEAYAGAQPYFDYQRSSFAFGRAAGIPGAAMQRNFYRGTPSTIPQWMQDIDMDPDEVTRMGMAFGIRPQGNVSGLLNVLGTTSKLGGFNYMNSDAVAGIARQGAGYGLASPTDTGMQSYLMPFAQVVQEAVSKGMDQSQQVSAMQGSLDILAKGGAVGASPAAMADIIRQFAFLGTPGGLSGSSAMQSVTTGREAFKGFMGNGLMSGALFSALPRYGYLKTPGDVRKFIGEQQWSAIQSGPGAGTANNIIAQANAAAQAGQYQLALKLVNDNLMGGDIRQQMGIVAPFAQAMTGGRSYALSTVYGGMFPGQSDMAALTYGGNAPSRLSEGIGLYNGPAWSRINPNYVSQVEGVYAGSFGGTLSATFDDKIGVAGYTKKLVAAGVPAKFAVMFAAQGQRTGVNPLLLASVAAHESGADHLRDIGKYRNSPGGDRGIMQISPANQKKFPWANAGDSANIAVGANLLRASLMTSGALVPGKVEIPKDAAAARSAAWATNMQESQLNANTFVPAATAVMKIRDTLIQILAKLEESFWIATPANSMPADKWPSTPHKATIFPGPHKSTP